MSVAYKSMFIKFIKKYNKHLSNPLRQWSSKSDEGRVQEDSMTR